MALISQAREHAGVVGQEAVLGEPLRVEGGLPLLVGPARGADVQAHARMPPAAGRAARRRAPGSGGPPTRVSVETVTSGHSASSGTIARPGPRRCRGAVMSDHRPPSPTAPAAGRDAHVDHRDRRRRRRRRRAWAPSVPKALMPLARAAHGGAGALDALARERAGRRGSWSSPRPGREGEVAAAAVGVASRVRVVPGGASRGRARCATGSRGAGGRRAGAGARRRAAAGDGPRSSGACSTALDGADGAIAARPGGRHPEAGGRGLMIAGTVDRAGPLGGPDAAGLLGAGPARRGRRRRGRGCARRGDRLRLAGRGAGRPRAPGASSRRPT